jgi:hypothetical protein
MDQRMVWEPLDDKLPAVLWRDANRGEKVFPTGNQASIESVNTTINQTHRVTVTWKVMFAE